MSSLFGVELPTPVNFIVAFLVVLALIGAATWAVRRFGGARLEQAARGRQPRLAVIDSANVDGRRKLVIIRRDNVEHLLMVGGPTDVVVETNIVRAPPGPARETPDQNLADMAQQIEAALRRPGAPPQAAPQKRIEPKLPETRPAPRAEAPRPAAAPTPQPKPAPAAAQPATANLEQEMASLLGRPPSGKT